MRLIGHWRETLAVLSLQAWTLVGLWAAGWYGLGLVGRLDVPLFGFRWWA